MPELTSMEKIQPCLLDRLTDDRPGEKQESRTQRVVTLQRFRDGVLRDLHWLLNTGRFDAAVDLNGWTHVRRSVLNYGMRDMVGVAGDSLDPRAVEREIHEAILQFEPRILRKTLTVKVLADKSGEPGSSLRLNFEIGGQLWANPQPESFFARTEIDLETGECVLRN